MGGDDSQKLLPWRGMILLSGAQQPPAHCKINSTSKTLTRTSGKPPPA
jgi:hypothetical protein